MQKKKRKATKEHVCCAYRACCKEDCADCGCLWFGDICYCCYIELQKVAKGKGRVKRLVDEAYA